MGCKHVVQGEKQFGFREARELIKTVAKPISEKKKHFHRSTLFNEQEGQPFMETASQDDFQILAAVLLFNGLIRIVSTLFLID